MTTDDSPVKVGKCAGEEWASESDSSGLNTSSSIYLPTNLHNLSDAWVPYSQVTPIIPTCQD